MSHKKLGAIVALAAATALALSACGSSSPTTQKSDTINNSTTLTVGWNQPFYSLNNNTSSGNNVTNANVVYLTSSTFNYYNKDLKLVPDTSFGTYQKTADSPLTVQETLSDKAMWSDGQPVVNADTILAYGAISGLFNTVTDPTQIAKLYDANGNLKPNAGDQVYFDASSPAWNLIKDFPTGDANGKSLTYKFSTAYADWEQSLLNPGLPAHIIGKLALGISDPTMANQAVVDAFKNHDKAALSKISNVWNSTYNFDSMPSNKDLLVSDGPYMITDLKSKQYVQLGLNPKYTGDHKPSIAQLIISFNEDGGSQLTDLQNGKVAIIEPQATADLLKNAQQSSNATVLSGNNATYEHVDLVMNNKGPFDPATYGGDATKAKDVRNAFLMLVPRQEIVTKLIVPLNPNATVRNSYNVDPGNTQYYPSTVAANGMDKAWPADVPASAKQKAAALLKQAGVKTPVNVRFLYAKSNPRRQGEYQLIKAAAQGLFNVEDNGSDSWSTLLGSGKYDASLFAWQLTSTGLSGDAANYITGGQNNFTGYSNKQIDALYKQLYGTLDVAQQFALNDKIEKILVDDAFGDTIFQFPDLTVYNKTMVQNVSVSPLSPTYFWNFWEWKLPNS